jgi:hypothetical protein
MVPPFLTPAVGGGVWSASRPGRFIPEKSPLYPLDGKQGGPGHCGEEKNLLPLPGIEPR